MLTRPLVVRGSLPVELTLQTGPAVAESIVVRGDAGFNTAEHPWSLAGDAVRDVGEPLPEPARTGRARQPAWLDGRGQRPAARARRGRWTALRAGRHSGLRTTGSAVRHAPQPVGDCLAARDERVHPAGVRLQERRGRRSADRERHPQGVVGDDRHRLADLRHATRRRIRRRTDWPRCRTDADRVGRALVTFPRSRCARELPQRGTVIQPRQRSSRIRRRRICSPARRRAAANRYDVPHNLRSKRQPARISVSGHHRRSSPRSWQRALSARTVWQSLAYGRHGSATLLRLAGDTPVTAGGERAPTIATACSQPDRAARAAHDQGRRRALGADARRALHVRRHRPGCGGGRRAERGGHRARRPDNPFEFADRRHPSLMSGLRAGRVPGLESPHPQLRRCASIAARSS